MINRQVDFRASQYTPANIDADAALMVATGQRLTATDAPTFWNRIACHNWNEACEDGAFANVPDTCTIGDLAEAFLLYRLRRLWIYPIARKEGVSK